MERVLDYLETKKKQIKILIEHQKTKEGKTDLLEARLEIIEDMISEVEEWSED